MGNTNDEHEAKTNTPISVDFRGVIGAKLEKLNRLRGGRGMNMDTVEFMVYGSDIHELEASSKTLNVISSMALESPNYLFVFLHILRMR